MVFKHWLIFFRGLGNLLTTLIHLYINEVILLLLSFQIRTLYHNLTRNNRSNSRWELFCVDYYDEVLRVRKAEQLEAARARAARRLQKSSSEGNSEGLGGTEDTAAAAEEVVHSVWEAASEQGRGFSVVASRFSSVPGTFLFPFIFCIRIRPLIFLCLCRYRDFVSPPCE